MQSVLAAALPEASGAGVEEAEPGVAGRLLVEGRVACAEPGRYAWKMAKSNVQSARRRITMAQMYHRE